MHYPRSKAEYFVDFLGHDSFGDVRQHVFHNESQFVRFKFLELFQGANVTIVDPRNLYLQIEGIQFLCILPCVEGRFFGEQLFQKIVAYSLIKQMHDVQRETLF
jgi:hypothetical protein